MRVLSIGNFEGRGWDGSITDENHIADALEELGHEVYRWQRETTDNFASIDEGWDFVLLSQWDGYVSDFIQGLRTLDPGKIVYWAFDYQADGQEWHERLVKQSDLYLSKRIADVKYPNWRWLSQDFAPMFLDKHPEPVEKEFDVLFTGSYLPWAKERTETLKAVDKEFDLHIFSVTPDQWREQGLKNVHGPVMDEGLPELYAKAKINLSIDHTIEMGYWSDRNAQIMACGRRPLFRYVPLSEARFGDRVDYFYSIEDCMRKIWDWDEKPTNADGLYVKDRVKDLLTIVGSIL